MGNKRHALGQHFLRDVTIAEKIARTAVDLARETGCETLLEVGPGKGAITLPLIQEIESRPSSIGHLLLSEADRVFSAQWRERKPALEREHLRFDVEEGDFLHLAEDKWLLGAKLAVASNLPYSAGTAIVTRLATHPSRIPVMVLMFQAEVAHRLRANPGSKDWGTLSLWIQNQWDVEKLISVPPRAFLPPPKVDSEVVVMRPRKQQRIQIADPREDTLWQKLLRTAFAHRRKMLRSGLPPDGPWKTSLEKAAIDPQLRAEALEWSDWDRWFQALKALSFGLVVALASPSPALANLSDTFGFGSRSASLAGSTAAAGNNDFAASINPAALALPSSQRLHFSWGVVAMSPQFTPIENVVVENTYTSDKVTVGNVDTNYRTTLGQILGISYQIAPRLGNLSVGLSAFLPLEQLSYLDTGEVFVPDYVLFRSRTQRPQLDFAIAGSPVAGLQIGAGARIGFSLSSNATVFLQTDASKPSTMRFSGSLKPKAGPYAGILWTPGASEEKPGAFSMGLVIRGPITSSNTMVLSSGARVFGSFAAVDFNFNSSSALYYDPAALETGLSWEYLSGARLSLQADFQAWKLFQAPALAIEDPNASCTQSSGTCGLSISGSKNPGFDLRNIWIPRIGHELTWNDRLTLRMGYSFRPSIFGAPPTAAGNYLDPDRTEISVGAGFRFKTLLEHAIPWSLDLHASYVSLTSQSISKTPGDENGTGTGDLKIGAPGYTAGGKILGGGLSISLAI